jgi:hypothetical protein
MACAGRALAETSNDEARRSPRTASGAGSTGASPWNSRPSGTTPDPSRVRACRGDYQLNLCRCYSKTKRPHVAPSSGLRRRLRSLGSLARSGIVASSFRGTRGYEGGAVEDGRGRCWAFTPPASAAHGGPMCTAAWSVPAGVSAGEHGRLDARAIAAAELPRCVTPPAWPRHRAPADP